MKIDLEISGGNKLSNNTWTEGVYHFKIKFVFTDFVGEVHTMFVMLEDSLERVNNMYNILCDITDRINNKKVFNDEDIECFLSGIEKELKRDFSGIMINKNLKFYFEDQFDKNLLVERVSMTNHVDFAIVLKLIFREIWINELFSKDLEEYFLVK